MRGFYDGWRIRGYLSRGVGVCTYSEANGTHLQHAGHRWFGASAGVGKGREGCRGCMGLAADRAAARDHSLPLAGRDGVGGAAIRERGASVDGNGRPPCPFRPPPLIPPRKGEGIPTAGIRGLLRTSRRLRHPFPPVGGQPQAGGGVMRAGAVAGGGGLPSPGFARAVWQSPNRANPSSPASKRERWARLPASNFIERVAFLATLLLPPRRSTARPSPPRLRRRACRSRGRGWRRGGRSGVPWGSARGSPSWPLRASPGWPAPSG